MINLYLDFSIYVDFVQQQPKDIFNCEKGSFKLWTQLWFFIESGADLTIINVPSDLNESQLRYITLLTEGRKNSKIKLDPNFKLPYKQKFNEDSFFQSIFFINVTDENVKKKYLKNNYIPVAFLDDYMKKFKELVFLEKPKGKSVRKKTGNFNSWQELNDYVKHISDIVIADNYLLSDSTLLNSNFYEIIKLFYTLRSDLNLTIITYNNPKFPFSIEQLKENIRMSLRNDRIKEKFNLILLNSELKEHDRGIFTNFLRIKSGDSFNYFNSKGEIITKGTELDFYSLTSPDYFEMTKVALDALKESSKKTNINNKYISLNNRLINELATD
jgi:hypothetical protein